MKQSIVVLGVVVGLIGGASWYGVTRKSTAGPANPEISQKIMLAEKFIERGEADKALDVFEKLLAEGYNIGQSGEMLRIQALEKAGRHEDAVAAAQTYSSRFPKSENKTEAELVQLTSQLAASGISNPGLRTSVEDFLSRNPDHPGAVKLHAAVAKQDLQRGDVASARRRLEKAIGSNPDEPEVRELARLLGDANLQALHSTAINEGDHIYEVKKGDYLARIAANHDVTVEVLQRCNNISDPRALRIGQKLKVPNVNFSLQVDIGSNLMVLNNHGQFFKLYEVRTGREKGATPTGTFKVLNKKKDPTWRPGNGHVYNPGDPNNELGTRWMAFEGDILGIHGTIHPDTIGNYASNGCVGMLEEEVQELFDLIVVGTALTIVGEQDFTRHKVIPAPRVPPPREIAQR